MEFPERMSERVTKAIADNVEGFSEEKLEQINYGIAVFIANSYKMLFLFIAAYLLKVLGYFTLAYVSFGFLRTFASGVHAKKEWTCLPASALLFFSIVYVGKYTGFNIISTSLLYVVCLAIFIKYAPADTEERPIRSKKLRRKLKIQSCIALTILYILSIYFPGGVSSNIMILSALTESALILPITYRFTKVMYNAGINK